MPFHLPSAVLNHDWDHLLLGLLHLSVSNDAQIQGLVYKTFVNKHTWETPLLPRKNKLHPLFNAGFFGKLKVIRLSFPHNQKHTSLETFFLSEPCAVQPNGARWSEFFKWIERATLVWNINILQDHKCLTVYQFKTSLLNKSINLFKKYIKIILTPNPSFPVILQLKNNIHTVYFICSVNRMSS